VGNGIQEDGDREMGRWEMGSSPVCLLSPMLVKVGIGKMREIG